MSVLLSGKQGECTVNTIQTTRGDVAKGDDRRTHQVQVCSVDTVVWEFTNKCDVDLDLKVQDFRPSGPAVKGESRDAFPLDPKCKLPVPVAREKPGTLTCKLNVPVLLGLRSESGRTYKYDIVWQGGASGKLDPEMEIYR